mmetsp:Transcript_124071/g.247130  ORF Transcript_124071/g.247130 Transcript_124071/m.247130 type:complete len:230 (-) Transcript_124071:348-1037(-)
MRGGAAVRSGMGDGGSTLLGNLCVFCGGSNTSGSDRRWRASTAGTSTEGGGSGAPFSGASSQSRPTTLMTSPVTSKCGDASSHRRSIASSLSGGPASCGDASQRRSRSSSIIIEELPSIPRRLTGDTTTAIVRSRGVGCEEHFTSQSSRNSENIVVKSSDWSSQTGSSPAGGDSTRASSRLMTSIRVLSLSPAFGFAFCRCIAAIAHSSIRGSAMRTRAMPPQRRSWAV